MSAFQAALWGSRAALAVAGGCRQDLSSTLTPFRQQLLHERAECGFSPGDPKNKGLKLKYHIISHVSIRNRVFSSFLRPFPSSDKGQMLVNITGQKEDDSGDCVIHSHQEAAGLRDASGSWMYCCLRGSAAEISAFYLNKGSRCCFSLHKPQPIFRAFRAACLSSRLEGINPYCLFMILMTDCSAVTQAAQSWWGTEVKRGPSALSWSKGIWTQMEDPRSRGLQSCCSAGDRG